MTVPHATKRIAFRFFGCLIFSIAAESTLFQSFSQIEIEYTF